MKEEKLTSEERLKLAKEVERKFMEHLGGVVANVIMDIRKDIKDESNSEILRMSRQFGHYASAVSFGVSVWGERLVPVCKRILDALKLTERKLEPLVCIKALSTCNNDILNMLKEHEPYQRLTEEVQTFIDTNKEILSVKAMKEKIDEEKAEREAAKFLEKTKFEPEQEEVKVQEKSQKQKKADMINYQYDDLCDMKRDIPSTRNMRGVSDFLCIKLDNFAKAYKMPMDAGRSMGCYEQAQIELDKIYDCLSKKESEASRVCISGLAIQG